MKRRFILTPPFERSLKNHAPSDDLQRRIEDAILENVEIGNVVPGTGGIRKFRLPDESRNKGTRGGLRVWFLDLPKREVSYLLGLYDKNEKDDLSSRAKEILKGLVEKIKREAP